MTELMTVYKCPKIKGYLYLNEIDEKSLTLNSKIEIIRILFHKLTLNKAYAVLYKIYLEDVFGPLEFKVEAILSVKTVNGEKRYLVKWKYWPNEYSTYQSIDTMGNCDKVIKLYEQFCKNERSSPYPNNSELPINFESFDIAFNKMITKSIDKNIPKLTFTLVTECIAETLDNHSCNKQSSSLSSLSSADSFAQSTIWFGPNCPRINLFTSPNGSPILTTLQEFAVPTLPPPQPPAPAAVAAAQPSNDRPPLQRSASLNVPLKSRLSFNFQNHEQKARENQLRELKNVEDYLNKGWNSRYRVVIENLVDREILTKFIPLTDYVYHPDVPKPEPPALFCECKSGSDCHNNRYTSCCSKAIHGEKPPYTTNKRLSEVAGNIIFECNANCKCDETCPFRVVQFGSKAKLTIFRTKNRGWGVRTRRYIAKNTFVMEYLGEVIPSAEADIRGKMYDNEGATYLFDLDYLPTVEFTVDAKHMGSVAKFVNHSCNPNMVLKCVVINNINLNIPRLALFSCRAIEADEELTFDYQVGDVRTNETFPEDMDIVSEENGAGPSTVSFNTSPASSTANHEASFVSQDGLSLNRKRHPGRVCLCGAANCRKFMY